MSLASRVQNLDIRGWLNFLFGRTNTTSNEITISGKKMEGANATRCNYSTTFQAVLYQIKKLDCASSNISKLSEIQLQGELNIPIRFDRYGNIIKEKDTDSKQREPNLIVSQDNPFKIGK